MSVARIDTPPLQPAALVFVSYGFVFVRVRVRDKNLGKRRTQKREIPEQAEQGKFSDNEFSVEKIREQSGKKQAKEAGVRRKPNAFAI